MSCRDYVVIFGAAVLADWRPSGNLKRRVEGALNWWRDHPVVAFPGYRCGTPRASRGFCDLLPVDGVDPARIVIEDQARGTMQSVRLCDEILRALSDVGATRLAGRGDRRRQ